MNQFQVTPPEKFTFKSDDWPKWIKQFDRFRIASGLETQVDENQVNALIYTMGEEAEDILVSLHLSPEETSEYDTVKGKLDAHFVARRNVIFERAKFNQRQQEMGESADCFITALHCLAEHCGYGTLHNEMVRDRLVVGLRDRRLSEQLQMDPELTLQKAVTRAKQKIKMDNHNTVFKIDTGADVTAVPETLYTQGQFSTLERATLVLKGPGRVPLKVKGKFTTTLSKRNKTTKEYVYVVEGLSTPLLSRPAATALQLVTRLEDVSLDSKETIKQEFPKLFSGLGKMEEFLIGKSFSIETDHKPLVFARHFGEWNLSRAPVDSTTKGLREEEINLYADSVIASLPATEKMLREIQTHQDNDDILQQLKQYCVEGWPDKFSIGRVFQPYLPFSDMENLKRKEQSYRQKQQQNYNRRHRAHDMPHLQPGNHVWVKDMLQRGTVVSTADTPRSYLIEMLRGTL
ncbi:hypothetical protein AAFF_G00320240 [Aldrovandia affinis]|uniref:Peptidase A2 domain-containing protein n=1 Tax=Aldrovandia affinis TaxID=143900 RepID=A0AAD7R793_9TELE|nr:hypothetical protein AAFF_G00320240 [Aldrovandia affinis]